MKIYMYALLFALVSYAHPMDHSQHSDICIIIKNNTKHNLWFSINAGGFFKKTMNGNNIEFARVSSGNSIFCKEIKTGSYIKTSNFVDGSFLTAKVAENEASLNPSDALLAIVFDPETLKDVVMLILVCVNNENFDFEAIKKNELCYLCKGVFRKNDEVCTLDPCGHCFHSDCYIPFQKHRGGVWANAEAKITKSECCPFCERRFKDSKYSILK